MEIRLDGARTLVTGGNSGIGAAIARALGQAGARVAINWVQDPDAAESVADDVRDAGPDALTVEADVSDPEAVEEMFGRIDDAWGGLDLLVNNAGIDGPREVAWEADVDAWRKVLEINLFGTFLCARQALRRMVEAGSGVILNVSSVHERIPWHGYSAYAAAKAGVSMLTKTLALEAAPEGRPGAGDRPGSRQHADQPGRARRPGPAPRLAVEDPRRPDRRHGGHRANGGGAGVAGRRLRDGDDGVRGRRDDALPGVLPRRVERPTGSPLPTPRPPPATLPAEEGGYRSSRISTSSGWFGTMHRNSNGASRTS